MYAAHERQIAAHPALPRFTRLEQIAAHVIENLEAAEQEYLPKQRSRFALREVYLLGKWRSAQLRSRFPVPTRQVSGAPSWCRTARRRLLAARRI